MKSTFFDMGSSSLNFRKTVDWSYEDGEDEAKGVYIAKLEELKKLLDYEQQDPTAFI